MANMLRVTGMREVLKNLSNSQSTTEEGIHNGIIAAGLYVQRMSQKIVPVDFGNLKNSSFTRHVGKGAWTRMYVGYTADYALYVHENLEARHKKGQTAKFLERPLREHRKRIFGIITRAAKRRRRP